MTKEPILLDDEELDTILVVARNRQSGRVTEFEIKELVRGYREHIALRERVLDLEASAEISEHSGGYGI